MFDLKTNYFEVFGLQPTSDVELSILKTRYLELQRLVHPDNHVSKSDEAQRQALQRVSYLNQAYDTLRFPLKRAIYLLQSAGYDYDPDIQIQNDPAFLIEQMELREQLSEVTESDQPMAALDEFRDLAQSSFNEYFNMFAKHLAAQSWSEAGTEINKMMFADKLLTEVDEKEELLLGS